MTMITLIHHTHSDGTHSLEWRDCFSTLWHSARAPSTDIAARAFYHYWVKNIGSPVPRYTWKRLP